MLNWDDIRLFRAVAQAGGLAGAAAQTQLSPPTLGRRILALEQQLGIALFERHRLGYKLTLAGEEFLERTKLLEQGALSIEHWRLMIAPSPVVKIAAGAWTSSYIAKHIHTLLPATHKNRVNIEIITGISFLDMLRRETNLGIRNIRPHQTGLAGRKIGQVDFAIYGAPDYIKKMPQAKSDERYEACEWITLSSQTGNLPSLNWLEQRIAQSPRIRCSSPPIVLDAALAGAGLCILPRFIGDQTQKLTCVSHSITALRSTRWLVSHDDDRHNKPIRTLANQLAKLFLNASKETKSKRAKDQI